MDFPSLLIQLLKQRRLTQKEFSAQVGRSQGFMSDVLQGKNGPSDDLETWAVVLKLKGENLDRFILAGSLARSPKVVQNYVTLLEEQSKKKGR